VEGIQWRQSKKDTLNESQSCLKQDTLSRMLACGVHLPRPA